MSRQIKFRAWDGKRMIYQDRENFSIRLRAVKAGNEVYIERSNFIDNFFTPEMGQLMQWIGLKDKSGVDVFEGDILESPNDPAEPIHHVVEWSVKYSGWFAWNVTDTNRNSGNGSLQLWQYVRSVQYGEFSVIGNIHEHPELLQAGRGSE